ncbi:hypothetical protein ACFPZ0_15185 [Streptomonospora nanhaiensis]|uniref:hypothetical protein n=1 Tax=Streptomonospora nanhaiensis TaxID=1323731 RepID=UPI001C997051|nr:hypothetical protein [Streptomonospora nanhaiensis]MBX9389278.1 hypothetical protein [Streptomonospora nanhaiensis]
MSFRWPRWWCSLPAPTRAHLRRLREELGARGTVVVADEHRLVRRSRYWAALGEPALAMELARDWGAAMVEGARQGTLSERERAVFAAQVREATRGRSTPETAEYVRAVAEGRPAELGGAVGDGVARDLEARWSAEGFRALDGLMRRLARADASARADAIVRAAREQRHQVVRVVDGSAESIAAARGSLTDHRTGLPEYSGRWSAVLPRERVAWAAAAEQELGDADAQGRAPRIPDVHAFHISAWPLKTLPTPYTNGDHRFAGAWWRAELVASGRALPFRSSTGATLAAHKDLPAEAVAYAERQRERMSVADRHYVTSVMREINRRLEAGEAVFMDAGTRAAVAASARRGPAQGLRQAVRGRVASVAGLGPSPRRSAPRPPESRRGAAR